jgi:hypothetical protein
MSKEIIKTNKTIKIRIMFYKRNWDYMKKKKSYYMNQVNLRQKENLLL